MKKFRLDYNGQQINDALAKTAEIDNKQDKLVAGEGIKIDGNTISSTVNSAE